MLFTLYTQTHQLIDSIDINGQKITYFLNKKFHKTYLRQHLYVEYQHDIDLSELDYTVITMPLIMNTIGMIWISNQDYSIPAMDKQLFYSLETIKEVFKRFYPATSFEGNLIPQKLVDNSLLWDYIPQTDGIALPFSHGLDSLCTSLQLRTTPQLLITARGMPDTPLENWQENWEYTMQAITHFAAIHGHQSTTLVSNFHEFFNWDHLCSFSKEIGNWRLCAVEGLGWMGLAAPILVSKGYRTFVLPANGDWLTPHPGVDCPIVVDNISFAGISNICQGFELNRMEKNKVIAQLCNEYKLEKPTSIICEKILEKRKNCCKCQKCVASILSLLLLNENPEDYGFSVDLPQFFTYFKNKFIKKNEFEVYAAGWFIYCQEQARKQLATLTPELYEFFNWFITIPFDALTLPYDYITLDYNNFVDLYKNIPTKALTRFNEEKK